ncbi:MAG: hypothetical protein M9894_01565 [Planctomycetes bacterium]|nr:hypothetical protein [Planctomycetota bacterium]
MMLFDVLVALIVTLLLGTLLLALAAWRRPGEAPVTVAWDTAALTLLGMFLLVFALGRWLRPLGFPPAGATWTPFLLVALLVVLALFALASAGPPRRGRPGVPPG